MNQINTRLSRQRDTLQALRPLNSKVLSDTIVSFNDHKDGARTRIDTDFLCLAEKLKKKMVLYWVFHINPLIFPEY